MRKKGTAHRLAIGNGLDLKSKSDNEDEDNSVITELTDSDNFSFPIKQDSNGNPILPDGTFVVEPTSIDEQIHPIFDEEPTIAAKNLLKCTVCRAIKNNSSKELLKHPRLKICICKSCLESYNFGRFNRGTDGKYEICSWCADGGELLCCDICPNAFCKRCIRSNLGRNYYKSIEQLSDSEIWKCFLCDMTPIKHLQEEFIKYSSPQSLTQSECITNVASTTPALQNLLLDSSFPSVQPFNSNNNWDQITTKNILTTINVTKRFLNAFLNDIKRLEQLLLKSGVTEQVVCNFKAIFEYNVNNRLNQVPSTTVRELTTQFGTSKNIIIKPRPLPLLPNTTSTISNNYKPLGTNQTNKLVDDFIKKNGKRIAVELPIAVKPIAPKISKPTSGTYFIELSDDEDVSILSSEVLDSVSNSALSDSANLSEVYNENLKRVKSIPISPDLLEKAREKLLNLNNPKTSVSDSQEVYISDDDPKKPYSNDRSEHERGDSLHIENCSPMSPSEKVERYLNRLSYRLDKDVYLSGNKFFSGSDSLCSLNDIPNTVRDKFRPKSNMTSKSNGHTRSSRSQSSNMCKSSDSGSDIVFQLDEKTSVTFARKSLSIRLDDVLDSLSNTSIESSETRRHKSASKKSLRQEVAKILPTRRSLALKLTGKLTLSSDTSSNKSNRKLKTNGVKSKLEEDTNLLEISSNEESTISSNANSVKDLKKTRSSRKLKSNSCGEEDEVTDEVEERDSRISITSTRRSKRNFKSSLKLNDELNDSDDDDVKEIFSSSDKNKITKNKKAVSESSSDDFVTRPKKRSTMKRIHAESSEDEDEKRTFKKEHDENSSSESEKSIKKRKFSASALKEKKKNRVVVMDDDEETKSPGRKVIRKILGTSKLSKDTRSAEMEERERRRRIEERQKTYNEFLKAPGPDSKVKQIILELEKENLKNQDSEHKSLLKKTRNNSKVSTEKSSSSSSSSSINQPLIQIHPEFVRHLKPHQVEAVRFLWDCVIESVELNNDTGGGGAILAHCMGLGKTLSTISFVHACMSYSQLKIKCCLILCPVNTVLNWRHEFDLWVPDEEPIDVFELVNNNSIKDRASIIAHWSKRGGVMLIGYEMFRNFVNATSKRVKSKEMRQQLISNLLDPGPDMVVCDEGHLLKNDKSGLSKCVNSISTKRRIVLTGTPLQNNLNEYWTMVNFVKPSLLGTSKEFANRFINPIKNGQHSNSTSQDVKIMKKRAHILYKTLDGCVQRKDYNALTPYLPPRYEYVLKIRLSEVQRQIYEKYLENRLTLNVDSDTRNMLFYDQQILYRIWTHPFTMKIHSVREIRRNIMDSSSEEAELSDDEASDIDDDGDDDDDDDDDDDAPIREMSRAQKRKMGTIRPRRNANKNNQEIVDSEQTNVSVSSREASPTSLSSTSTKEKGANLNGKVVVVSEGSSSESEGETSDKAFKPDSMKLSSSRTRREEWWRSMYKDGYDYDPSIGCKLDMLLRLIKHCSDIGDKVLVFSHSLFSLDLIEKFLTELDIRWRIRNGEDPLKHQDQWPTIMQVMSEWQSNRPDFVDYSKYFCDNGLNTWLPGHDYERMDGSVNAMRRKSLQTRFNKLSNRRLRLFLISTRAGGLGINLVGANRLILFDVSWNPSHDVQSIFRSYRFGQNKPVYIYRLISQGTMEEKMYDRQVTKQSLALRVIDEQQIDRHFSETDLAALYSFDPDIWDPIQVRPTPTLPKDRLLADMLQNSPELIVSYHTHDSLLENREDEGLTEAERQEAWKEFEEEKRSGISLSQLQRVAANNQMYNSDPAMQSFQLQIIQLQQKLMTLQQQQNQLNALQATAHLTGQNSMANPWITQQLNNLRSSVVNTQDQLRALITNQQILQQQRQLNMFNGLARNTTQQRPSNPAINNSPSIFPQLPRNAKPFLPPKSSTINDQSKLTPPIMTSAPSGNGSMNKRYKEYTEMLRRLRPDLSTQKIESLALDHLMEPKRTNESHLIPRPAPLMQYYQNKEGDSSPQSRSPKPLVGSSSVEDLTSD